MKLLMFGLMAICMAMTLTQVAGLSCTWTQLVFDKYFPSWVYHRLSLNRSFPFPLTELLCQRFAIFKQKMQNMTINNNDPNSLYKQERNKFSDYLPYEFDKITPSFSANLSDYIVESAGSAQLEKYVPTASEYDSLPSAINWVKQGKVTPVQNQGQCGSCYAFSTADAIASAYSIKYGTKPVVLSQQQIVDCSFTSFKAPDGLKYKNEGCGGGLPIVVMLYAKVFGLEKNADYPYVAQAGSNYESGYFEKCKYKSSLTYTKVSKAISVDAGVKSVMAAVAKGPAVALIDAVDSLSSYASGIFTDCPKCDENNSYDHAVLIVGYNTTAPTPYWLVKNSWDTDWGEDGYFRLPMGKNACCVEGFVSYPVI